MTAVRPAQGSDEVAIRAVTTRAFTDHGPQVAELVDALAADAARISLVADDAGAVVGHVMLSRGWIDAEPELVEALVLSPLSVDPPWQGHGIGASLVRAALEAARANGAPAVFLEGSPYYYSRFGFVAGRSHGFTRPSARVPHAAFQVAVLPAWEAWMTGALVYPEAFWTLDLVGLRGEQLAAVRDQTGESAPAAE